MKLFERFFNKGQNVSKQHKTASCSKCNTSLIMSSPYISCPGCKNVAIDLDSVTLVSLLAISRLNDGSQDDLRHWQETGEATFQQINPDFHKALSNRSTTLRSAFMEATHEIETVEKNWIGQALSLANLGSNNFAITQNKMCGMKGPTGKMDNFCLIVFVVMSTSRYPTIEGTVSIQECLSSFTFVPARMS